MCSENPITSSIIMFIVLCKDKCLLCTYVTLSVLIETVTFATSTIPLLFSGIAPIQEYYNIVPVLGYDYSALRKSVGLILYNDSGTKVRFKRLRFRVVSRRSDICSSIPGKVVPCDNIRSGWRLYIGKETDVHDSYKEILLSVLPYLAWCPVSVACIRWMFYSAISVSDHNVNGIQRRRDTDQPTESSRLGSELCRDLVWHR